MTRTAFTKQNLVKNGWMVEYIEPGTGNRIFVARFKRGAAAHFMNFIRRNFTVEEYFSLLNSGLAPMEVAATKDYVTPSMAKALRAEGYPVTRAGMKAMIEAQIARHAARRAR